MIIVEYVGTCKDIFINVCLYTFRFIFYESEYANFIIFYVNQSTLSDMTKGVTGKSADITMFTFR